MQVKAPHTDFSQTTFQNVSPSIFYVHNPPNLVRALFPFCSNGASKHYSSQTEFLKCLHGYQTPITQGLVLKHPMKLPLTTSGPFIVSLQVTSSKSVSSKSYRVPIELTMCTKNFSFSSLDYYLTVFCKVQIS